jgi:chromate transport protein ChrA
MKEAPEAAADVSQKPVSLAEIALLFLKLGTSAFGGSAAHIAMVDDEFVVAIALISAILLFRFRVNSAWLVIGAAVVG